MAPCDGCRIACMRDINQCCHNCGDCFSKCCHCCRKNKHKSTRSPSRASSVLPASSHGDLKINTNVPLAGMGSSWNPGEEGQYKPGSKFDKLMDTTKPSTKRSITESMEDRNSAELELRNIPGQLDNPFRKTKLSVFLTLHEQAAQLNCRLFDVEGKGACFFHSVFAGMYVQGIHKHRDGFEMKEALLEHMRTKERREFLEPFIVANEQCSFEKYIKYLRTNAKYPGEDLLSELAQLMQVKICVWPHVKTKKCASVSYTPKDKEAIGQVHIGNIVEKHFVAMLPLHEGVKAPSTHETAAGSASPTGSVGRSSRTGKASTMSR